jgi:hypothetical protein
MAFGIRTNLAGYFLPGDDVEIRGQLGGVIGPVTVEQDGRIEVTGLDKGATYFLESYEDGQVKARVRVTARDLDEEGVKSILPSAAPQHNTENRVVEGASSTGQKRRPKRDFQKR